MMTFVQVESLVVELDDLAVRQGEEEARRHQNLIEEVEDLRAQLILAKRDAGHVSGEGQLIYAQPKLYILPTGCICVFDMRMNSDYFS
jgi:hypothetical protein